MPLTFGLQRLRSPGAPFGLRSASTFWIPAGRIYAMGTPARVGFRIMEVTGDQMVGGEKYRVTYKPSAQETTTDLITFRERDDSKGYYVFEPLRKGGDPMAIPVGSFIRAETADE